MAVSEGRGGGGFPEFHARVEAESGSSGFHAEASLPSHQPCCFDHLLPTRPSSAQSTFQHDKMSTFGLILVLSSVCIVASCCRPLQLEQQDSSDLKFFPEDKEMKRHLSSNGFPDHLFVPSSINDIQPKQIKPWNS